MSMWAMKDTTAAKETTAEQRELMDGFAEKIVERRLTAPAILFLESVKPLSFLGNQAMVFFQPIVQTIFGFKRYDDVTDLLEDRENVEYLLRKIEELAAEQKKRPREEKERPAESKAAAGNTEEGADEQRR